MDEIRVIAGTRGIEVPERCPETLLASAYGMFWEFCGEEPSDRLLGPVLNPPGVQEHRDQTKNIPEGS